MLIDSAVFGSLEVEEDHIFHMPEGPFGFPGGSNYALITKSDEGVTLMWFQAVEANVPCFVVFNPFDLVEDYRPQMDLRDRKALGGGEQDLFYLVIAVVPEDITKTTVNLKSPIVVNKKTRTARQVILSNPDYPIKFPLAAEPVETQPLKASV